MIFTRKRHIDADITLSIDGESIYEVQKTKFPWVIIDKKRTWKEDIALTSGKISRGIGMVIKARNYLNKSGLITIYYSFIYLYLTCCNHIWGCTYKTNLQRLVTLQKGIVRIISHAKARDSSHPLYTQLGIMKFSDLNTYLIARLCSDIPKQAFQTVLHLYSRETANTIIMRQDQLIIFTFQL